MRKICIILKSVLFSTLIVVCLCSCGKDTAYYMEDETSASQSTEQELSDTSKEVQKESEEQHIYVYVCGQVQKPGVYTIPEGSRVCDLFAIAGGFTEGAATEYWNQARVLKDGEMIYVPTKEEAKDRTFKETVSDAETDAPKKVNINTASKEELLTIPGVGEAKASAILAYREENGPFSSIEELKKVDGIKDGVFSKMKEYIEI